VPGHPGQYPPLAAVEAFRAAADEHHEQGDEGGGKEEDQAAAPFGRHHRQQGNGGKEGGQDSLGEEAGDVGLQPFHAGSDRLHQRAGLFAGEPGRTKDLEPAKEPAPHLHLHPAGNRRGAALHKEGQDGAPHCQKRHNSGQGNDCRKLRPVDHQPVTGLGQQPRLDDDQHPGHDSRQNDPDQFSPQGQGLVEQPSLGPQGGIRPVAAAQERHELSCRGMAAMLNEKTAPLPVSPFAQTSPPWRWMIRCTVARPMPVPSNSLP